MDHLLKNSCINKNIEDINQSEEKKKNSFVNFSKNRENKFSYKYFPDQKCLTK